MLDPQILKEIKRIQLSAGHLATEALSGNYASAFKGQGMEFTEVREYTPGDDIRFIDWNVTARTSVPHIKKYREEREMTLMIVLDVSGSQNFSSTARTKLQYCTELAAILAFLATKNNDKVGVILFSDEVEEYIPPKKGRAHIWHIIRSVLTHQVKPKSKSSTRIDRALDFLMQTQKKRTLTFLISDFLAENFDKNLRIAARRHEMICVLTQDKHEWHLPEVGVVGLRDQETGRLVTLNTHSSATKKLIEAWQKQRQDLLRLFRRQQIESFYLDSDVESAAKPLVQFLQRRQIKGRR